MILRVPWYFVLLKSKFNYFHVFCLLRLICLINKYSQKILIKCFLLHSCQTNAKVSSSTWLLDKYLLTSWVLVIILLWVFTSNNSTKGYYLLFKQVFSLVYRVSYQPILFDPIHGSGIHGIIVDMDLKQYTGKYLLNIS
jgi:hypothetical protein